MFRFQYKSAQDVRMEWYEPTLEYITIGSRYDAGQHDGDGRETIKIAKSVAHEYYYQPGNAIALYKLETPSSHTPVPFPASQPVTVHADEVFSTMGWTVMGDSAVITEQNVTVVGAKVCVQASPIIVLRAAEDGEDRLPYLVRAVR